MKLESWDYSNIQINCWGNPFFNNMKFLIPITICVLFILFLFYPTALYSSEKKELYGDFFEADIDDILENMSLKEKLGQILMFGFKGYDIDDDYRKWISSGELGNIKIFLRNVKSKTQLSTLVTDISIYNDNTRLRIPPFIATDLEGGMVNHIRYDGIALAPSAALVSASRDYKLARLAAKLIANNLLSAGINMNLAPCFDVLTTPDNRVIDTRSYSSDPEVVYRMASIFIDEHRKLGIITVPKHFPGHGMSNFDSHTTVGIVDIDLEKILKIHILPYLDAQGDGTLDALMVSNIIYSSIDEKYPASLSTPVINGLLRDYLGFRGIVVTDDLEMKGAEGVATDPINAFILSFNAGCDILLFAHSKEVHKKLVDEIPVLFTSGVLNEKILNEKVRRVLYLKKKYLKKFYEIKEGRGANELLVNTTEKQVRDRIGKGITLLLNKTGKSTNEFFREMRNNSVKGIIISPSGTFTSLSSKYLPDWKVIDAWYLYRNRKNKKRIRYLTNKIKGYKFAIVGFSNEKHLLWLKILDKCKVPYALFIVDHPLLAFKVINNAKIAVTSYGSFLTSVDAMFRRVFEVGEFTGVFPYKFYNWLPAN